MNIHSSLDRHEIIPSIVSYSPAENCYVVGKEARQLGIKSRTTAHNFKIGLGSPPAEFNNLKQYWMDHGEIGKPVPKTYTCREVATIFLQEVLRRCIGRYAKIMVGLPAIQDETWLQHYRSNIREIVREIGFPEEPGFLYEPFAVFQFYRHVERLILEENRSQLILLIDIGGGTCNTCIFKTTEEGKIALGNQAAKPYGPNATLFGGKAIDVELLRKGIREFPELTRALKEDPVERAKSSVAALLKIEEAKIKLSESLCKGSSLLSQISAPVHFERGELLAEKDVEFEFTSLHLERVVRDAWIREWLPTVLSTLKASERQLGTINSIDKVILCGGSGQLPFLREFVAKSLAERVSRQDDVIVGTFPGFSVAKGIQKECEIRAGKDPSLLANDLGRWALSSMYLGFRHNRIEDYFPVKVRQGSGSDPYLLLPEWTRLDGRSIEREIDLPFDFKDRLYFGLFDRPVGSDPDTVPLNVQQDTLRIPKGSYRRNAKFIIRQTDDGALQCEIHLAKKTGHGVEAEKLRLPEFFPESLRLHAGKSILGLDLGTSNTYLVEMKFAEEMRYTDYFSFRIKPTVKDQLADLHGKINELKKGGLLVTDVIRRHAFESRVDFVCHSVKLEGASITRGETYDILEGTKGPSSRGQIEAKQLGDAYLWLLDNYAELMSQPEPFARELNKRVIGELHPDAGAYRKETVKINTRNTPYLPPDGLLIAAHMRNWANYVRNGQKGRSPVEFAAALHSIFVRIHPFVNGNGRTARLLVNAFLLSEGLPVVIPTIDDRERYIDSLAESDSGNGDGFTMYFIELFEESIQGLRQSIEKSEEETEPDVDLSLEDEDPLAVTMGRLIEKDRLPAKRVYEPWKATFNGLRAEMELLVSWFNEKYAEEGYESKLRVYDILSEEKFCRLFLGLPTTKTWFFGLELSSRSRKERFMFYFGHVSHAPEIEKESTVNLRIGRNDGDTYRNLTSDVFQPCEIGWKDGSTQFDWPEEQYRKKPLRFQVRLLLSEIIKAFFEQPSKSSAA